MKCQLKVLDVDTRFKSLGLRFEMTVIDPTVQDREVLEPLIHDVAYVFAFRAEAPVSPDNAYLHALALRTARAGARYIHDVKFSMLVDSLMSIKIQEAFTIDDLRDAVNIIELQERTYP